MRNDRRSAGGKHMKNKTIYIAAAVCLAAVIGMVLALLFTGGRRQTAEFTPPSFDAAAQAGTPAAPDESWTQVYREGMDFSAHTCGKPVFSGSTARLDFTNDAGNNVWLKLRILDEKGNILAESGLIKPGEYLASLPFSAPVPAGTSITMKIMAYEPNTYCSAGAVTLHTTAGG